MARTMQTARKTTGGTAPRRAATRAISTQNFRLFHDEPGAQADSEPEVISDAEASGIDDRPDITLPPPAKKPKRLPASSAIKATDSMVAVKVGTDEESQTFHVHATQLRKSSEYLKAKAKPEWSKGKATVDLSHQDPAAFNIYVNWLYTGQILSTAAKKAHASEEWLGLARAFTLGEELMDQDFKNAIMSALSTSASEAEVVNFLDCMDDLATIIYDGTPDDSPARKFLVDIGKSLEREQLSKLRGELHADFTFDLAIAGAKTDTQGTDSRKRKRQPIGTIKEGMCDYHEHEMGKGCQ